MSNSIIVLSQKTCRPCSLVKSYLDEQQVNYDYIDIQDNREYIERFSIMSTPVTLLLDENSEEIVRVNGFDIESLDVLIEQL